VVRAVLAVQVVRAVLAVQEALAASAEPAVPDALVVLAGLVVPAGLELRLVQAPLELVRVPGLAQGLQRAQLVVPPKNKSGTAARHRGKVRARRRVEDLAAVAETMREPAATEVAKAWVAAVTAVVAAVVAAVE
jgi:hypothetical protein